MMPCPPPRRLCPAFWFMLLFGLLALSPPAGAATGDPFPLYDCIRPNVAFWLRIYTVYTSREGVLHDSNDLSVVYEVLDLDNSWLRRARRRNQRKVEAARRRYRRLLLSLARGRAAATPEARRVAALFGADPDPERFRAAADNIRLQRGQKDIFRQGIIRSGRYLAAIKRILRGYGLPEDLAYLPHVESAFNYQAYSKFGAAGIWQFTRATGRRFLTIDYVLDERRDPIRATHAAARLLRENYAKLGDWPLAITAYNHGANGMLRAKAVKGGYQAVFKEYDGKRFGFASRNFYSEFLAARQAARDARRFFGPLESAPPLRAREVTLPGYAPAAQLARFLGVRLAVLRRLNPALREPVFLGRKYLPAGYRLRLPPRPKVLRLASNLPRELLRQRQKRSRFYLVRRGDTAGRIARLHGIGLRELISANGLDRRATVYAGQNLRIPLPNEQPVRLAGKSKRQKGERRLASLSLRPEMPAPGAPPVSATAGPQPATGGAARDAGAEPAAKPVSLPGPVNPAVVVGDLKVVRLAVDRKGKRIGVIRVEPEETLGHYAEWLGVRARDLRRLNGLRYGRAIRVGQRVRVPLDRVDQATFEERRYEYHKEMEEDFFSAYRVAGTRVYRVKRGDNIWQLCQQTFGLPFWLLRKYNPDLDAASLKPEQTLLVPEVLEARQATAAGGTG